MTPIKMTGQVTQLPGNCYVVGTVPDLEPATEKERSCSHTSDFFGEARERGAVRHVLQAAEVNHD